MAIAVSSPGAFALKKITSTIPVVFVIVPAPIGSGLAASLAHPGSNLTGLSFWAGGDPPGKSLALLKEAVPNLSSAAVFFDPDPQMGPRIPRYAAAAKSLGLSLRSVEIPAPDAIEPAFAAITWTESLSPDLCCSASERALAQRRLRTECRPSLCPYGLLMIYGPDFPDYFRRAAGYVDKILHGAKPADLPVEQPTGLKQVINLKAAKALGLTIPSSLLVTADEVIE